MNAVDRLLAGVGRFWSTHQDQLVLGVGAAAALLVGVALVRLVRSRQRSRYVGVVAAVTVLAWTSEGLWQVARVRIGLPLGFAIMTFFVFEAMMISAALRADEHRAAKGVPGPAGRYVWVIAACSGFISALGAHVAVEVPLRIILPLLAVGLWWVGITAERSTDTDEMRAERARLAAEREATWVHTPRTVAVALGLMKPGSQTTTEAQRAHQVARMVLAADRVELGGWRAGRARKRLRRMTRTADRSMVDEVAERVGLAAAAERLMVPSARERVTGHPPTELPRSLMATAAGHIEPVASNGHRPAPLLVGAVADRSVADEVTDLTPDPVADPSVSGRPVRPVADEVADGRPGSTGSARHRSDRSGARRVADAATEDQLREWAREAYRESVEDGRPMSGAELARAFEQSNPRWGTRRINEVRTGRDEAR